MLFNILRTKIEKLKLGKLLTGTNLRNNIYSNNKFRYKNLKSALNIIKNIKK